MAVISIDDLLAACSPGGASVLTSVTELAPAAGEHASVAPARFVDGNTAVFAYETRYIDGEANTCVVIDSKQSQLNRIEMPLLWAIRDEHPLLSRVPHVEVRYSGSNGDELKIFTDLELPHRAFDGHIRAGTVDGIPSPSHPTYRAVRDCTPGSARALVEFSPGSLVFGSWDSTRRSNQGRYRSALVGEIIGVLSDQDAEGGARASRRGGARVDPVGMQIQLDDKQLLRLLEAQKDQLSPKLVDKVEKAANRRGENAESASTLGLGGIPPSLEALGGVSCSRIIRSHVLSFATLRQLRFGASPDGDAAVRALLAAYALAGLARSDAELYLRANCDLVEKGLPVVRLDGRFGTTQELDPLTIEEADGLMEQALARTRSLADVPWDGQVFAVEGNNDIYNSALGDVSEE